MDAIQERRDKEESREACGCTSANLYFHARNP
jgi:hypothetical protein